MALSIVDILQIALVGYVRETLPLRENAFCNGDLVGLAVPPPNQSRAGFDSRGERNCFSDPARIPLEALRQFPKAVVYMQASNLLLQLIRRAPASP
jgi:hypothetical protein